MQAKRIFGFIFLSIAVGYGLYRAFPVLVDLSGSGANLFFFLLIMLVLVWAVVRILNS
ncbi:MAG: hypothetical protein AAF798_19230 [Bacteroidota bacterium]